MSHYRTKVNSLAQDCQINRSNLQAKLLENLNIMYTYIVDQTPYKQLKCIFSTGLSIIL